MVQQPSYWRVLTRRKVLPAEGSECDSKLNRVLGLYDLTALGVGSTLGAGVYVLAGQIAKEQAGPSVMISFAIAALASLLAGVCYAEFGARVPKAGSAYIYSYVCIGEFAAFVIGWNLILEYIIGTASVCRGISLYLDTLLNDTLKHAFQEVAPLHVSFLGSYFDFFACGIVLVFGVALAFGVETSTMANNFCTCLNICVLLFVIIAGSIKANFENWNVDVAAVNSSGTSPTSDLGKGGYFPFGFEGTLKGAATCFFGFVGFDCIATTGEEVRNPRRNIPRSILLSLLVIFLCYFGVSTVLTLMVPYYLQDPNAPLPYAFKQVGWNFAMWMVAIGGLIGLMASLFGALFPLPRIMYSMAEDGLLFKFLGKVSPRFRVPVVGSIFAAVLTALIAGLFDLAQLVNLLSIGTLLAYSVVAISVTILRYMDNTEEPIRENGNHTLSETSLLTSCGSRITCKAVMWQLFNLRRVHTPTSLSIYIVGILITLYCLLSLGIGLVLMQAYDALIHNQLWVLILLCVLVALTGLVLLAICLQPRETYKRIFRVPFVPMVPALSIFINIYLMLQLDVMTWIRFGIWMIIGIPLFIACVRMYDSKNPCKRNPSRIAFANALKEHTPAGGDSQSTSLHVGQNGTILSTQSKHSVKSLDEIVNLNEVSEDLIEMRHPNGKIFFIEDNRSNTSKSSASKTTAERDAMAYADILEDERSVIALLDYVIQSEESGAVPKAHIVEYNRKISVDSEMLPSVIETTIVATVHSSSDTSEYGLDELPEMDTEHSGTSSNSDYDMHAESHRAAENLVNEILDSDELYAALRAKQESAESMAAPTIETVNSAIVTPVAMRSVAFKEELSRIILHSPANKPNKATNAFNTAQQPDSGQSARPTLKHSKSEADVERLIFPADTATNSIPKPPKFDPVLYRTIKSLRLNSENPNVSTLLEREHPKKPKASGRLEIAEVSSAAEMPFKLQLEAMLRRGPVYRTQSTNVLDLKRPKSMHAMVNTAAEHK